MRRFSIRAFIVFTLLAFLTVITLSGCFLTAQELPGDETPETPTETSEPEPVETHPVTPIANNRFTLRYNPKSTLNPLVCTDSDNLLIASLMYEGLFALDEDMEAVAVLCERYETEDNATYTFYIRPDIGMHDGSVLTATDVAYSLIRAQGRYANRLSGVESVAAEDELTVVVTLSEPNSRFIKLLDIPVIKYGAIDSELPPGTGPYMMISGINGYIVRYSGHRDFTSMPVSIIYLRECGDLELIELFSDGEISLLWDNPGGPGDFRVDHRHETRFYDTTKLQFIGFNTRGVPLRNSELRRAIGLAVDRTYIVGTVLSGYALAAPLAFSPAYPRYDSGWVSGSTDSIVEMSGILAEIGLDDVNNDTYLEFPDGAGGYMEFALDFVVNKENSYKVTAAKKVAESLRRVGFNIGVRELAWDDFLTALETGDFDMYYGETELTADFDLSPLLAPDGTLDYGGTGEARYAEMIAEFLSAAPEAEKEAAHRLCTEIAKNAPFIPVAYKKQAVHSVRGMVAGASPTMSNVFFNLSDWTIKPGGAG